MLLALDRAYHQASDPPDVTLAVISSHSRGSQGRPRIEFDPRFLSFALETRSVTDVARAFNCSPRTVRRRALELGLLEAGQKPFETIVHDNGTVSLIHSGPPRHTRLSVISDNDLDTLIWAILRDFPDLGRRMIDGRLRSQGVIVSRRRIRESYIRLRGPPPFFARRLITRRKYFVEGVNSLWHHDGQHGKFGQLPFGSLTRFIPSRTCQIQAFHSCVHRR
jgi:hypothetical protein